MCGSRWHQLPVRHPDGGRRLVSPRMTTAVTITPLTNPSARSQAQTGREINNDAEGQVQWARDGQRSTNKHRHQWRDEREAVEDGAAPAAADAASLNAARIKSKEPRQQMSEPSPMADRLWPLEVHPIVKARRMQVTAQRLKLWQKPFATKRWPLRRNCLQSHGPTEMYPFFISSAALTCRENVQTSI